MTEYEDALELTCPPQRWFVDLVTGETLEVATHGYSIENDRYIFSLLFCGTPNFEVTVLSLPAAMVAGTRG